MRDMLAVAWKERRMLLRYKGGSWRWILTLLGPVLLAIYTALGSGYRWVDTAMPSFPTVLIAVMVVIIIVPESFAGERERHTLETLLSTRLSDSSIVFGKMLVAIAAAMLLVVLVLILGLVTVNLTNSGELMLYSAPNLVFTLFINFVSSTMVTAVGVLISLKSETVQEATQILAGVILVPPIVVGMVVLAFRDELIRYFMTTEQAVSGVVVILGLVALTLGLIGIARWRFQRSKML